MNCVINFVWVSLYLKYAPLYILISVTSVRASLHTKLLLNSGCIAPDNLSSLPVINWHHYADAHHRAKFYLFLIIVIQALIICRLLFYYIGTFNIYFFLHMCVPLFSQSYLSRCTLGLLPFYSQSLVQN